MLSILGSLLIGGLIGSALKLEIRLENVGENLRNRFGANKEGTFVEGFVSSSLLFVIGPLAILGSISDGHGIYLILGQNTSKSKTDNSPNTLINSNGYGRCSYAPTQRSSKSYRCKKVQNGFQGQLINTSTHAIADTSQNCKWANNKKK